MKIRAIVCVVVALLSGVGGARGAITLKLAGNLLGDQETVSVQPGAAFDAYIKITTTLESTVGVSLLLTQTSGLSNSVFRITAYDPTIGPYSSSTPTSASVIALPAAYLDPTTDVPLSGLVANMSSPAVPSTYTVAKVTILTDPSALPGTYVIGPDPSTAEVVLDTFDPAVPTIRSLTVTMLPEPSSFALVGLAGLLLMRRR